MTALMESKTVALREAILEMVRGEMYRMIGEIFQRWRTRRREMLARQWRAEDAFWGLNVARQGLVWLAWRFRAEDLRVHRSKVECGIQHSAMTLQRRGLGMWQEKHHQWCIERRRRLQEMDVVAGGHYFLVRKYACFVCWQEKAVLAVAVGIMWQVQKAADLTAARGQLADCWFEWRQASLSWRLLMDSRVREEDSRILRKGCHKWHAATAAHRRLSSLTEVAVSMAGNRQSSLALAHCLSWAKALMQLSKSHETGLDFHRARSLIHLSTACSAWRQFAQYWLAHKSLEGSVKAALWGRMTTVKRNAFQFWLQNAAARKLRCNSRIALDALGLARKSHVDQVHFCPRPNR